MDSKPVLNPAFVRRNIFSLDRSAMITLMITSWLCLAANAQISDAASAPPAPSESLPAAIREPRPLLLVSLGKLRPLPQRILGASAEPLIEHLLDDPRRILAVKNTAPAVLRFPGGSQSNYYDWRTGLLQFPESPNSSAYMKFWAAIAPKIARAFPNGITMEQYASFAREIGADTILVPNLETSTVAEQVAWFRQLATAKALPRFIELGNEFYIAMLADPEVMRKWPNEPSALAVMKQYAQALRPIAGPEALFAVQSAGSAFWVLPNDPRPFMRRLRQWDADLAPADWFQAVTVHLYPEPARIAAEAGNPRVERLFALLMGRVDQGVDRVLADLAQRVPDKEIWITEWNPRGGSSWQPNHPEPATPAMSAHLTARMILAQLRHPAVTKSLYFMLNSSSPVFQAYVQTANRFEPMPATVVLGWFDHAANGGSSFERVAAADEEPVTGLGVFSESYRPIEGAVFRTSNREALILQNASDQARLYDPSEGGKKPYPKRAELLVAGDFKDAGHVPAQVAAADPAKPVVLPPYSIAHLVWE
jgi:hypothetical protein